MSRPVARIHAARSAAVSRNRWCPGPVAGLSMPRQVRGDDVPTRRGERRTHPPPDPCRRGDPMDEDQRPIPRDRPRPAPRTGSQPQRSRIGDPDPTSSDGAVEQAATAGGRSDIIRTVSPADGQSIRGMAGRLPFSRDHPATSDHCLRHLRRARRLRPRLRRGDGRAGSRHELRFGFPAYYVSSRLVLEGDWGPAVYDDAWFRNSPDRAR